MRLFLVRFEGFPPSVQLVEDPLIGPTVHSVRAVEESARLVPANLSDRLCDEPIEGCFAARSKPEAHD
jgi:hypothetical protein